MIKTYDDIKRMQATCLLPAPLAFLHLLWPQKPFNFSESCKCKSESKVRRAFVLFSVLTARNVYVRCLDCECKVTWIPIVRVQFKG